MPRRGTVHDMGRSVTHKAVICYKRLVEQKPTSQVAEETFHSAEEIEYYVQCLCVCNYAGTVACSRMTSPRQPVTHCHSSRNIWIF